jgi:hypothetical protein
MTYSLEVEREGVLDCSCDYKSGQRHILSGGRGQGRQDNKLETWIEIRISDMPSRVL